MIFRMQVTCSSNWTMAPNHSILSYFSPALQFCIYVVFSICPSVTVLLSLRILLGFLFYDVCLILFEQEKKPNPEYYQNNSLLIILCHLKRTLWTLIIYLIYSFSCFWWRTTSLEECKFMRKWKPSEKGCTGNIQGEFRSTALEVNANKALSDGISVLVISHNGFCQGNCCRGGNKETMELLKFLSAEFLPGFCCSKKHSLISKL